jgi:hypothetical protein
MAKTLLQLTNEVGKNLRRSTGSTYTSITQNADVVFIVQAINEAKRMVEDDWESDILVKPITFSSVAGTHAYDLSDLAVVTSDPDVTTDRSTILRDKKQYRIQAFDVTDNEFQMRECSREYAQRQETLNTTNVSIPGVFSIYPNANGLTAHFPFAPDSIRNYKLYCKVPQDDLALAATEITVPWRPVVLAATAIAVEERGEELGMDASRWWEQYEKAFGSMVARESYEQDLTLVPNTLDYMNPW